MLSPPLDDLDLEPPEQRLRPAHGKHWSKARIHRRRRRVLAVIASVLGIFLIWLAFSLGSALTNPALGSSMGARAAEWFRGHGGASIVVWVENEWYSHHQPKVGGALAPGTIQKPKAVPTTPAVAAVPHLPVPAPLVPIASPAVAGEGQWSPAGRLVQGLPAIYETMLRPSAIHTSYVVGVAWMDTKLLKATLYSGSQIPGGGPYTHTAPIAPGSRHHAGRRIQRRLPHVRRQRGLLHRRQDHHPAAHGCSVLRRVQERFLHRGAVGTRRHAWDPTSSRSARTWTCSSTAAR